MALIINIGLKIKIILLCNSAYLFALLYFLLQESDVIKDYP